MGWVETALSSKPNKLQDLHGQRRFNSHSDHPLSPWERAGVRAPFAPDP